MTPRECAALERIAGLAAAAAISIAALIMDGPEIGLASIAIAGGCAGLGSFLGARRGD